MCALQNFPGFIRGLMAFLGLSVPAAVVNSGLRCAAGPPMCLHARTLLFCGSDLLVHAAQVRLLRLRVTAACAWRRFFQKQIQLAFMMRLTRHLHRLYCSNRSYYAASVLGGTTRFWARAPAHCLCRGDCNASCTSTMCMAVV